MFLDVFRCFFERFETFSIFLIPGYECMGVRVWETTIILVLKIFEKKMGIICVSFAPSLCGLLVSSFLRSCVPLFLRFGNLLMSQATVLTMYLH